MWLAGGGFSRMSFGETDDFCYNVAKDLAVHDLCNLASCLGIDHERLT